MPRCVNCGFLCTRRQGELQLNEAGAEVRDRGELPGFGGSVLCFARVADLMDEYKRESSHEYERRVLAVIGRERDCEKSVEWVQGFSPKEHKEMIIEVERQKQGDRQRRWDRVFDLVAAVITTAVGAAIGYYLK